MTLQEIGGRVAALRAATGLSREKFARLVAGAGKDVTGETLLNLENAKGKSIDVFLLDAIARAAGVTLADLILEEPAPVDRENVEIRRFAEVLAKMGPAEVEPHLRALELLSQERETVAKAQGKKKSA